MTEPSAVEWAAAQLLPWGHDGDLAGRRPDRLRADRVRADRIRDWAESGVVALTGRADGPPLVPPGAAATAALGAEAAFGALANLRTAHSWHRLLGQRAALLRLRRRGPWSAGGSCRAVRALDGWVAVSLARPDDVAAVAAIVSRDLAVDDAEAAWSLLDEWAARRRVSEVVERAALVAVPCGAVPPPGEWRSRERLVAGVATAPVRRLDLRDGDARADPPMVVDLSALWAGPLCAHLLGVVGAHVVKVESSSRLDGARRGDTAFYDALHAGHDSVVVDLDRSDDRELLARLLHRADVVIEASRPRALQSWGVDAEQLCRATPTTWVSITAYGRTAPDRVGFGDDVAMAAGLAARDGDDRPLPCGDALADPLTGMHAAVAALASHRAGGSRILDVAMADVVAAALAWSPSTTLVAEECLPAVEEPVATPPRAPAAAPGRDTDRWRS
jgi:crotonobetainyl-CoA:carnitine CoA-transferase CaiB-like acyl-CoA transferase